MVLLCPASESPKQFTTGLQTERDYQTEWDYRSESPCSPSTAVRLFDDAVAAGLSVRPLCFDTAGYRLLNNDQQVPLSPKVLDLLRLLVSRPSELVTKETILRELWPDVAATDNAIMQAVSVESKVLPDDRRWCMNRSWPATIPAHAGHLPMAYDAGLPR
jgi:hypothetical protein